MMVSDLKLGEHDVSEHLISFVWWLLWGLFAVLLLRLPARSNRGADYERRRQQDEVRLRAPEGIQRFDHAGGDGREAKAVPGGRT